MEETVSSGKWERLENRLGDGQIRPKDGTVIPRSEEEIREVIQWARETGTALIPQGKGAFAHFGNPVTRPSVRLSMERMSEWVEHSSGDLVVTVQAGMPLSRLQEGLRNAGQMLPLDPAWPDLTTAGGAVAMAATGPKRLKYGLVRDTVIGLRVVLSSGEVIRSGGKVVKNVAGYDMNKLFVGSMGTLGVITECTFKLRPLPPAETTLVLKSASWEELERFCRHLLDSYLEPSAMEAVNARVLEEWGSDGGDGPGLVIGFEDEPPAVEAQKKQVLEWAEEAGLSTVAVSDGMDAAEAWNRLRNLLPHSLQSQVGRLAVSLKLITLPSRIPEAVKRTTEWARERHLRAMVHGSPGTGLGRAVLYAHRDQQGSVADWITEVREWLEENAGRAVLEHAPEGLKEGVSVWGRDPGGLFLMKGIKQKLDPEGLLNPGRMVGGI